MWFSSLRKRLSTYRERVRKVRRRAARRLIVESLEGRRVLTSGVPFESFDNVFDPALPAGWVSTGTGGAWTTVSGNSHTANIHAFIANPNIPSSGVLSSVPFTPTAQSSIVNFAHSYNTEATYDGGILEIAIPGVNNGLFQEITAAGGTFITGGYNSTINPSASGTFLAGRQAWSGNSGGYVATSVKLPPSAIGQNIQLAWSFASDTSVGGVGWRVDSISLSGPVPHIDLANLTPSQGSVLFGEGVNDESGKSVAIVGDVNGDGYDDMLVGAPIGNGFAGNLPNAGQAHLVFGGGTLSAQIDLASAGSTFYHDVSGDQFGRSVGSAGDFNGDGFGDFFVGADQAAFAAGETHVFFGNATGSNFTRIKFTGIDGGDQSGFSVSSAGDVNGDGFDDLLVGARSANSVTNGRTLASESYLIFGKGNWTANQIVNLATVGQVGGTAGVTFFGSDSDDRSGISVSGIGDVNGDGFDDLAIGAFLGDGTTTSVRSDSGETAILFGKSNWTGITSIDLATLGSNNGLTIFGVEAGDYSGISVSRVGDLNGDGFDDIAIGAYSADAATNGKGLAGDSYIVFGASSFFGRTSIDLATLGQPNQPTGITIFGAEVGDRSGYSISGGGDLNGDGFDDLVIGAKQGDALLNLKTAAGDTYVVFGGPSLPPTIDLATLGANALAIFGANGSDQSGTSVSLGGDVNGDGFDDLLIGANLAASLNNSRSNAGESYLIFGGNGFTNSILPANIGTSGDNTINGTFGEEILVGGDGNDTLQAFTGADVLLGGRGDDIIGVNVGLTPEFKLIVGGNGVDTLLLAGNPNFLDLTRIPDNRLVDIEVIDMMTGAGSNTLVLNQREVLNISSTTNTLTVIAAPSKRVFFESGWTKQADNAGFQVFTKGAATLRVSVGVSVNVTLIDLAELGAAGSTINGAAAGDRSGNSVSNAGDVNGDGYDDFIIGANRADLNGQPNTDDRGKSYVLFGGPSMPTSINLSDNLGTAGITITGQAAGDFSGVSVSSAGDINGDGFDDLIVGASSADPANAGPGDNQAGKSYVIFGGSSLPATITLSDTLSATNAGVSGFTILGQTDFDYSGSSVSSAGDVNGDGFDDLIVGARLADPGIPARTNAGKSYVIFGKTNWSGTQTITLSDTLSATNAGVSGFTILGQTDFDYSGSSVSSAGDVNGDGFDDLIVRASNADPGTPARDRAGKSYVIFGKSDWSGTPTIALSDTLSTTNPGVGGFTILGQAANDYSGFSVSSAGDVNGDGFDDLIVGAFRANPGTPQINDAGKSYVIFGKSDWSTTPTVTLSDTLSTINPGVGGFTILGEATRDESGSSVSGAGDVNGDGFDDLIVGAPLAGPANAGTGGNRAGKSYVIFGGSSLPTTITLSDNLAATNPGVSGFTILGQAALDYSGSSVSGAGDVNGDGFDDLIVGASSADPANAGPGDNKAGKSYILYGGNGFTNSILAANLGTSTANTINGTSAANILNGADGDDILVGLGGADILLGGRGNDTLAISDLNFRRIIGGNGNDTLRLDGTGFTLDLSTIRDNRIVDIEEINITGSGNNTLTLAAREVLNLSSHSNTLTVRRNTGDVVNMGTGWTRVNNETISGVTFEVFRRGAATIKIQLVPTFVDNGDPGYTETGTWSTSGVKGFNQSSTRFASAANATATWNAPSLAPGYYEVQIWKVAAATSSPNARVSVVHNGITEPPITLNFSTGVSGFISLGTYFFSGAPGEFIRLSQGPTNGTIRADAVRFVRTANVNVAPTINAPTTQSVAGNSPRVFSTANANSISVTDVDAGVASVRLTLSATNGSLTLPSTTGLVTTGGSNGQSAFTVEGTLSSLNTALNGLSYLPNLNFSGSATIQLTANDLNSESIGGAKSASTSIVLTVNSPVFVVDNGNPGYAEVGTWSDSGLKGFNQSTTRFASASNATATWNAPSLAPGYYQVAIWKLVASISSTNAQVLVVHNGITEAPIPINFTTGAAGFVELGTFFFSGAPGEFVRLSQGPTPGTIRADAVRFTRSPIANAAPIINAPATQTVAGNTPRFFSTANSNAISVSDVDAGVAPVRLTLSATNGLLTLPSTSGLVFTSGSNGQAAFTIQGTLSSLNAALNGLRYLPNLNFSGSATIQLIANDLSNGSIGGAKSASKSIALTVNSPVFVVDNGNPGYVEVGVWSTSGVTGFNQSTTRFASASNATATWNAPTLAPGNYQVAIWKVVSSTSSSNARVSVVHNGITSAPIPIDFSTGLAGFVELGTFFFSGGPGEFVRLLQGPTSGTIRADAVRFTKVP